MKFTAHYFVPNTQIYDACIAETKDLMTSRSKVTITKEKDGCSFFVEAKDYTAFRAMNNAVQRILTVFFKMSDI